VRYEGGKYIKYMKSKGNAVQIAIYLSTNKVSSVYKEQPCTFFFSLEVPMTVSKKCFNIFKCPFGIRISRKQTLISIFSSQPNKKKHFSWSVMYVDKLTLLMGYIKQNFVCIFANILAKMNNFAKCFTALFSIIKTILEQSLVKYLFSFSFQVLILVRDGEKLTIKADELTVGDIVEIKFGDRVPADIRVLEARSFKVITSYMHYTAPTY